jgi:4-aminobutyrate aminotransferase / (S)-3-amino-2-methylpropionate transaminase / 5-aminovalerate transaminase
MGAKKGEFRTVPGEKGKALLTRREKSVPRGIGHLGPIYIANGRGAIIEDVDGNEYIDFVGGIGCLTVGHCHPEIIAAIKDQADKFMHTCFHAVQYESYIELAEKLIAVTPGNFEKQAMFANSGAEAVENAVKIARRYTGRYNIIAFERAYHGRTLLTMGLTSQIRMYKYGYGPTDIGIYRAPYPYEYRCPYNLDGKTLAEAYLEQLYEMNKTTVPFDSIAAIIFEPIQGEGGYVIPPAEYVHGLKKICDENGILLISDEIQVGLGRTGKMWAIEHSGVVPDMITLAKSVGGGTVLSAIVGRKDVMNSVDPGGIGGTFGGNPLSCVAGLKTLEIILREDLLGRAVKLGEIARKKLDAMKEKYEIIGDIRQLNCAIGIEFVKNRKTKCPATEETKTIVKECYENGLLIMAAGPSHNVLRPLFPIIIDEYDLQRGLDILAQAINKVAA